jgi:hypothetical protein
VPMRLANRVSKSLAAWSPQTLQSHGLESSREASRHNSRRASRQTSRESSRSSSPLRGQQRTSAERRWSVDEGKLGTYELDDELPHILGFDNMFCESEEDLFAS